MQAHKNAIVVIGAGAAGIFAAIQAARAGAQVTVLESTAEALAKVRISGGGRCNVSTAVCEPRELVNFYPRGAKELLGPFRRFGPREMQAWLRNEGVALKTEADGRVFPTSDQSATIIDALLSAARAAGVFLRLRTAVKSLSRADVGFVVQTSEGPVSADRLLLSTGGARPGHALAASLGHRIVDPVPSLFTFRVDASWLRELAGLSVEHAVLKLQTADEKLQTQGPLLITHWGLSGPAVLRASAWGARILAAAQYQAALHVDWTGASEDALRKALETARTQQGKQHVSVHPLAGIPRRLWQELCARAALPEGRCYAELTKNERAGLLQQCCACPLTVSGKGVFKEEFVTAGGVAREEIDWRRMASRVCPGLYFAGEIIDIDGLTGGFNFSAAWTTAWIAGHAAAESSQT